MKRTLPICLKPIITSECNTYYKFAIIQTNESYKKWLLNYLDPWTEETGRSFYGNPQQMYELSYYNDILEIKDGNILSVEPDNIINYLIDMINADYYVVLDLNFRKLFNISNDFRLHETLIYGYDLNTKCFYSPILQNGAFTEQQLSFDVFKEAYSDVYNHYNENKIKLFQRLKWFYGITLLRPKNYIEPINIYFDFIRKLWRETFGYVYEQYSLSNDFNLEKAIAYYTGHSSLILLNKIITEHKNDNDFIAEKIHDIRLSCLKLYEHRRIILTSMETFIEHYNLDGEIVEVKKQYAECCEEMHLIFLLCTKYCFTHHTSSLLAVADKLLELYNREHPILEQFIRRSQCSFIDEEFSKNIEL